MGPHKMVAALEKTCKCVVHDRYRIVDQGDVRFQGLKDKCIDVHS